jgi:sulfur-carrier protein
VSRVSLHYFAWVREAVGLDQEAVDLPMKLQTPRDVATWLRLRGHGYDAAFADLERIRCALDQTMASLDTPIGDAAEIAFFPPVTGG